MEQNKLRIGVAEVSIVPEGKKISLDGQFFERITDKVETVISYTCLIAYNGTEQMTLLSADLGHVTDTMLDDIREGCKDIPGFDPMKIIMNATHTHTSHVFDMSQRIPFTSSDGLDVLAHFMEGKTYKPLTCSEKPDLNPKEARTYLVEQGIKAVHQAWENLHEAHVRFGFGRAAIGLSRRVCYDDGRAKMWGDCNQPNFKEMENGPDTGIELSYIYNNKNELETIIANVACPSQVCEQRSFISADFWGELKKLVRKKYGEKVNVVALTSAAGDLCPRDLIRWVEPETPIDDPNIFHEQIIDHRADFSMYDLSGCRKIAKRIFHEIEDNLEENTEKEDPISTFRHDVLVLELPLRRVTMKEKEEAENAIAEFAKTHDEYDYHGLAAMHGACGVVERFEVQKEHDTLPTEVHVIRFGSVAFVSFPFELFVDFGNQMRGRSLARQTFLIQLANGAYRYLPTEKGEQGGHYSGYVASGFVGHEGGDMLVRSVVDHIRDMFTE